MYRKQMLMQKIICFIMLASSVVVFAYSLGIMSDLYESFYYSIRSTENPDRNPIAGSLIYTICRHSIRLFCIWELLLF
ncbi:MAG: hypothetical protein J5824_05425 [Lachnospiraceae bacterium]|nr:hypothetical protein [Lachnospiraceae bacterium]